MYCRFSLFRMTRSYNFDSFEIFWRKLLEAYLSMNWKRIYPWIAKYWCSLCLHTAFTKLHTEHSILYAIRRKNLQLKNGYMHNCIYVQYTFANDFKRLDLNSMHLLRVLHTEVPSIYSNYKYIEEHQHNLEIELNRISSFSKRKNRPQQK